MQDRKNLIGLLLIIALSLLGDGPTAEMIWNHTNCFRGWRKTQNGTLKLLSKSMVLENIQADVQLYSENLAFNPLLYNRFSVRYRAMNIGPKPGQLFFAHHDGHFMECKRWIIPRLHADGKWHTLVLGENALADDRKWFSHGMITRLRLDLTDSPGGCIEIDEIRLFQEKPVLLPLLQLEHASHAPKWPAVIPKMTPLQLKKSSGDRMNSYFQGKMIRSPEDRNHGNPQAGFFFLRRSFQLKRKPQEAWVQYTADDGATLYVNGHRIGSHNNWRTTAIRNVTPFLHAGENVLGFKYENSISYGGVLGELFVRFPDNTWRKIDTDKNFRCFSSEHSGWCRSGFDCSKWQPALEFPAAPHPPWLVRLPYVNFVNAQRVLGTTGPKSAYAGQTISLCVDMEGERPCSDIWMTVELRKGTKLIWQEPSPICIKHDQITALGENRWQFVLSYELPLYLASSTISICLQSNDFYFKLGAPKLCLSYKQARKIPGFEAPPRATAKRVQDVTCFEVNGKDLYPIWGGVDVNGAGRVDRVPRHSDAPLNLVTIYHMPKANAWWTGLDSIDGSVFDRMAESYRRQHPEAYFIWDLTLYPPREWERNYPQDMCLDDKKNITRDGYAWGQLCHSFASRQAIDDCKTILCKALDYLEHSPYANRIIGYRINAGHTVEWLGWDPEPGRILDFSPVAQVAFRKFAKDRYPELKDCSVPSLAQRCQLDNGELLWNPQRHLSVIAYHDFYSNAIADMLIELCSTARKSVQNRKLIGTYYGYTMTLNTDGHSQMRAHFSLKRVLDANVLDFIISPHSYSIRNLGETLGDMKPFASMQNHGIVPIIEDDSRTHNSPLILKGGWYQTLNQEMTMNVVRRNMGVMLCRNVGMYFYALCAGSEFDFPQMSKEIALVRRTAECCLAESSPRQSEIAIVVSEESIKHMPMLRRQVNSGERRQRYRADGTVNSACERGTVLSHELFTGNLKRFARIGAPTDYLLAEDLVSQRKTYKFYIFINVFVYDEAFCAAINKLRKQECTLLWIYAPGYIFERTSSLANMERLTGFHLAKCPQPLMPAVKLENGSWMGTTWCRIAPLFHVIKDNTVSPLGFYEDGSIGMARRQEGAGTSYFIGTYQLGVQTLIDIAHEAGVHLYSHSMDPVEANQHLVTLHARTAGKKWIFFPRKCDVLDVFNRRIVARDTTSFAYDAPLHSSWLFYYGNHVDQLLKQLQTIENQ